MTELPTAAIYARVSDPKQVAKSGLTVQVADCERFASGKYNVVATYRDEGISGAFERDVRRGLDHMLTDAEAGRFKVLLVWDLDRLAREPWVGMEIVMMVHKFGILVVEATTGNAFADYGMLMGMIKFWAAGEDRKKILNRTKRGQIERAKSGKISGPPALGYDKSPSGGLVINEEEAEIVRRIFDLYVNQGHHLDSLASLLNGEGVLTKRAKLNQAGKNEFAGKNNWQRSTIKCVLTNSVYKGTYVYGKTQGRVTVGKEYQLNERRPAKSKVNREKTKIALKNREFLPHEIVEVPVPAIVSPKIWQKAQDIMADRASRLQIRRGATKFNYHFKGVVRCHHCNRVMTRTTLEQERKRSGRIVQLPYYVCRNQENDCPNVNKHHRLDLLDLKIIERLIPFLDRPERLTETLAETIAIKESQHSELLTHARGLEARLLEVQSQIENVKEAFYAKAIPLEEFKADRTKREAEIEKLTAELSTANHRIKELGLSDDKEKVAAVVEYFKGLKADNHPAVNWVLAMSQDPDTLLHILHDTRQSMKGRELPPLLKIAQSLVKTVTINTEGQIVQYLLRIQTTPPTEPNDESPEESHRANRKCMTSPSFTS